MVSIKQIEQGAVKYIDREIAPKIPANVPNGQQCQYGSSIFEVSR